MFVEAVGFFWIFVSKDIIWYLARWPSGCFHCRFDVCRIEITAGKCYNRNIVIETHLNDRYGRRCVLDPWCAKRSASKFTAPGRTENQSYSLHSTVGIISLNCIISLTSDKCYTLIIQISTFEHCCAWYRRKPYCTQVRNDVPLSLFVLEQALRTMLFRSIISQCHRYDSVYQ